MSGSLLRIHFKLVFVLFCGPQLRLDFEFFLLKSRAMWQPVTS